MALVISRAGRPAPPARSRRYRWRRLLQFVVLAVAGDLLAAHAAAPPPTEHEVKAVYLYNLARFIEWPVDASAALGDHLVIGVIGDDPFGPLLDDTVRDKAVPEDQRLVVRRFTNLEEVVEADILFISSSEAERLPQILKILEGSSILTVGEMDRFAERGGMVALRLEDKKVRFDINLDAVRKAKLKLSSHLLKLARIFGTGGRARR
jgi:hypothetical protein